MKDPWRVWGVFAILVVVHFFLHLGLGLGPEAPDLLTVALLVAAREVSMGSAAGMGFVLGLLEDAFSVLAFGGNALAMTVVGVVGARTRDLFVGDSMVFVVSYLFLGKWVRDLIHWMVAMDGIPQSFTQAVLVQATLAAVYATAVGIVAVIATGTRWDPER
ncbi:MAG TPA: rod shape-determining protein MreD [Longimicrobiales bacterium]